MLRYIMAVVLFLTVFTGCAQKTNIKAIKAGKVNDSDIRSIAVLRFQNDSIGQSDIISSKVVNHTIDGKKYFQVASRKDLNVVLNEKKLNDSGLVDIDNTKSSGLTQVKTLLLGRVLDIGSSYSYYRKDVKTDSCRSYAKTKKGKSYCKEYYTRTIACKTQNYTLSTNVKLVKVRNSKILFSKNYSAKDKKNHCENDSKILPDKYQMASKLAKTVADDLLLDIAPSYTNFSVGLLDDPDTNYSSKSTGLLKLGLKLIEKNQMQEAHNMLTTLNKQTSNSSYVALYNLGVTKEALGDHRGALSLYNQANKKALSKGKIVDEIASGIKRAKKNIIEQDLAKKQMNSR